MNTTDIIIRCSALGQVMTEPKLKFDKEAGNLSETAKTFCKNLYREIKYKRHQEFSSKYTEKGIAMEEDGLTLLSDVRNKFFQKNSERLTNDYVTGEPDAFIGKSIKEAVEGFDVKCPYTIWTLPFKDEELNKNYYWQAMGYMWLTGANKWTIAYTLVNAPSSLIVAEKQRLWYSMNCPDDTNPQYLRKRIEIEKNLIFDMKQFLKDNKGFELDCKLWDYDIPKEDRLVEFVVNRDEAAIQKIIDQVVKCRKYLAKTFPSDFGEYVEPIKTKVTIYEPSKEIILTC